MLTYLLVCCQSQNSPYYGVGVGVLCPPKLYEGGGVIKERDAKLLNNPDIAIMMPLCIVCRRGSGATPTGPVGMEELSPRPVDPLIGMGSEIITLGL